jgi:hypothetical protein
MKNLKTLDVIKIVPLEEVMRQQLLAEYDSYDDARKYDIQEIVWAAFHEMREQLIDLKYQEYLEDVEKGIKPLANDLYDQAVAAVWKNFDEILAGNRQDATEIDSIRTKLQALIGSSENMPKN